MEPRIQYAKTKDGVNVAFWILAYRLDMLASCLSRMVGREASA
jgi:hypothetical protein